MCACAEQMSPVRPRWRLPPGSRRLAARGGNLALSVPGNTTLIKGVEPGMKVEIFSSCLSVVRDREASLRTGDGRFCA